MVLRRWESIAGNLVLTTELKTLISHRKGEKKLTFRALALHQSSDENNDE